MGCQSAAFLDESAANERTMDRKYGWAPVGVTSHEYKSIKRSERWSILPVYTVDGFYVWDIIQGSYTKELFTVKFKTICQNAKFSPFESKHQKIMSLTQFCI